MIKIESKADRVVMWVLIGMGLYQVFVLSFNFGQYLVQ